MNEENYQLEIDKKTCKDNTEYEFAKLEIITTWKIRPSGRRLKPFSQVWKRQGPSYIVSGTRDWTLSPETTLSAFIWEDGFTTSRVKVDPADDYS